MNRSRRKRELNRMEENLIQTTILQDCNLLCDVDLSS